MNAWAGAAGVWHWAHPEAWWLLLLIPVAVYLRAWWRRRNGVVYPAVARVAWLARGPGRNLHVVLDLLRLVSLILLIAVLARPQSEWRRVDRRTESLDILMVLDLSESMRATDIQPNRLAAAKAVLREFVRARGEDNLGVVVFSGAGFTLMPLTGDHEGLLEAMDRMDTDTVRIEGTAIGEALLVAANRFRGETGPGRVVILATDGVNNRGVDALLAARVLARRGIKLYTIGLGGERRVRRLTRDSRGRWVTATDLYGRPEYWEPPDESTLKAMAAAAGGLYFRAGDRGRLEEALARIHALEKNPPQVRQSVVRSEQSGGLLAAALLAMAAELILARTRFRSLA